jgi:hypothetical protein
MLAPDIGSRPDVPRGPVVDDRQDQDAPPRSD